MSLGGFRSMWVMVMFDLPTEEREDRREYSRFRKHLLSNGFVQLQYSVYARYCNSLDQAARQGGYVAAAVPPEGEVRVLTITEKQFQRMRVFLGKTRKRPEQPPRQLEFF